MQIAFNRASIFSEARDFQAGIRGTSADVLLFFLCLMRDRIFTHY